MKRAYHGDWMESLPSRLLMSCQTNVLKKMRYIRNPKMEDFDFDQDISFEDNQEYRSPGWNRLKKKKLIKWKK